MLDYLSRSSKNSRVKTARSVLSRTIWCCNSSVMGAETSLGDSADCDDYVWLMLDCVSGNSRNSKLRTAKFVASITI